MRRSWIAALVLLILPAAAPAASEPLPVVEDVEWGPFRDGCARLLDALEESDSPLPAATARRVRRLLGGDSSAAPEVQKLLDPHCLLAVHINAESRVKAARGPAGAVLRQDRTSLVLVKVHNEGGVTHALRLEGPGLVRRGGRGWLGAEVVTAAPFGAALTGRRVEYRLLRLTPRQAGKREATFRFDVGQGTQDLGFRAEVPVLFDVRRP